LGYPFPVTGCQFFDTRIGRHPKYAAILFSLQVLATSLIAVGLTAGNPQLPGGREACSATGNLPFPTWRARELRRLANASVC
jgi:hypothetical protein